MSPAAKTPGTEVIWFSSVATLPRGSRITPSWSIMPFFTGPRKPMARSTKSASSVSSVPGAGANFGGGPMRTACNCFTRPCSSPVNFTVETLQSRTPPSSCELSTRSCMGQRGHGVEGERSSGGLGNSSNCVTEAAPWRWVVPRQSAPASPRILGAAGQQDGAEFLPQVLHRNVDAHVRVGLELHSFGAHLLQTAIDQVLLHFEVGNAVAQEAADAVALLEDRHAMPGARQLLCGGQARRPRTDHRHPLAGARQGRLGLDETLFESTVRNRFFDLPDGNRRRVDAQHARGFAGGRANAAGEFGEVVGGVQAADGAVPAALVNQVVPVWNDIVQRAAGMAEGDAAIHAAGALRAGALLRKRQVDFKPVLDALSDWTALRGLTRVFEKTSDFTHGFVRLFANTSVGRRKRLPHAVASLSAARWGRRFRLPGPARGRTSETTYLISGRL